MCTGTPSIFNPLDFYLWGTLKNSIYATKLHTQKELKDMIEHAINDITLAIIQTICRSIDVVVGNVLSQKVNILNIYGLNEV